MAIHRWLREIELRLTPAPSSPMYTGTVVRHKAAAYSRRHEHLKAVRENRRSQEGTAENSRREQQHLHDDHQGQPPKFASHRAPADNSPPTEFKGCRQTTDQYSRMKDSTDDGRVESTPAAECDGRSDARLPRLTTCRERRRQGCPVDLTLAPGAEMCGLMLLPHSNNRSTESLQPVQGLRCSRAACRNGADDPPSCDCGVGTAISKLSRSESACNRFRLHTPKSTVDVIHGE